MHKPRFSLLPLLLASAAADAAGEPRFTGSAALAPATPVSADARFALNAELARGDLTQSAGRFALRAGLAAGADAKSIATACTAGGVDLFKNSFEN